MRGLVVDASITAAWCFEDEQVLYARRLLRRSKDVVFHVPAIWPLEMANVLLVNERRKRITASDTIRFVALLHELGIQVDRPAAMNAFDAMLSLGRTHGLSAYDAAYLELALRKGFPLASRDAKLRAAALHAGATLEE